MIVHASGVLVGAVVPNLAPCRCGASRRPIPQGGISHGISIAGCGCNSAVAVAAKVSLAVDVTSCGSVAAASSVAVTVLLLC